MGVYPISSYPSNIARSGVGIKTIKLNKLVKILAGAVIVSGIFTQVRAEDAKIDPTGSYIWTMPGRNGGPDRTNTLSLKLEGDKLTGKLTTPGRGGAEPT